MSDQQAAHLAQAHLVLARKYRPQDFSTLYGQDALVRTLTNALQSGRLAQAYMLTGVRGVGKTTTARIIARALNCIGPDGNGGPTAEPCGVCSNCTSIASDRHPDVLEMDAASRTGVGDVRELIDSVRYAPVQARNKVYIIDEVHMLSKQAFNALLKTLEEPPPHVKFIFATTEIRQVPVTILSRCQRFDLRRINTEELQKLFTSVLEQESVKAEDEAIRLIARAADGSARDGLSLLDQAIALSDDGVEAQIVRDMLGQADRGQLIDLFKALLSGEAATVLGLFDAMYNTGAEPLLVIRDLSALSHLLTRTKVAPEATAKQNLPELEHALIKDVLHDLHIGVLGRLWQALQQGLITMERAQDAKQAGDMVLMRLCHMANVPTPGETLKQLQQSQTGSDSAAPQSAAKHETAAEPEPISKSGPNPESDPIVEHPVAIETQKPIVPKIVEPDFEAGPIATHDAVDDSIDLSDLSRIVDFLGTKKEVRLAHDLRVNVRLVSFEKQVVGGRIELQLLEKAPEALPRQLQDALKKFADEDWQVEESDLSGEPTLHEQTKKIEQDKRDEAIAHPLVQSALEAFPQAELVAVRTKTQNIN